MDKNLLQIFHNGEGKIILEGASSGVDALILSESIKKNGGQMVYVATDDQAAQKFANGLLFFAPDTEILKLPSWDCLPYDRVGPAGEIAATRLATLSRLANLRSDASFVLITTASSLMQKTLPKARLLKSAFSAKVGDDINLDDLQNYLAANGYNRTATVREKGEFAIRGGVIDLFAPQNQVPVRLDLFGDNLESIRTFDVETQRSIDNLQSLSLVPVSEVLLDNDCISLFRKNYLEKFGAPQGDALYESVSTKIKRNGMEHWLPMFYDHLESLFDYVSDNTIFCFEHGVDNALIEREKLINDYYQARLVPPPKGSQPYKALKPDDLYLNIKQLEQISLIFKQRIFNPFTTGLEGAVLNVNSKSSRDFAPERADTNINVWESLRDYVRSLKKDKKDVIIAAWTDGSAERLAHVLTEHGMENLYSLPNYNALPLMLKTNIGLAVLPIEHGFEIGNLVIISEQDVLGDRLGRGRKRRKSSNFLMEASSLNAGDLIVHIDHGIGRYEGLKTLEVMGSPHDCLELIYQGGDKLFLPVENIDLISRYGADGAEAILDKLGGVAWQGRKARAKKRLLEMAAGLIRIAAVRSSQQTEVITPIQGVYDEFCARFPYDETDDQINAIDDVLEDLQAGKPMDRLICGDVGFGKTEVALRAAFTVAMSGRQVAVVCPTTLLSRQHYKTFTERFNGLPIRVRQLSRMVGSKEATETRSCVADGRVDILVGTHAVLSKQVSFNDLGLVIVDEEQHFGVKHKERLKEMRADTHFLTLTATPIPRTLQMSLSGIREMSIIATPPVDRLATRTYVTPFDAVTVREAILREKYRGGQSFFVAPRIEHLRPIEEFLRENVPEIKFRTVHGQMPPTEIEPIINAFYDGDFDVLLSTTIVESGIDIPRANTLIVWRSDMLGLAAAYQLRGRVGRSKARAYAYLTIPDTFKITPQAEKRLKILQSLDSLGAGFQLASHDLDMRGGGNLLGEEQSGNIKEVGVELYQQMLEEAVAELRNEDGYINSKSWSPTISIGLAVLIPEDYVPDLGLRLSLYRRLAEIESDEERDGFAAELIDRFGKMPLEVNHLIEVAGLKALCKRIGIEKLIITPNGAVAHFKDEFAPDPIKLIGLMQSQPSMFRLRPDGKMTINGNWQTDNAKIKGARAAIVAIIKACA
jgi:transcription-repair coupling factor (superfamily II helicase)